MSFRSHDRLRVPGAPARVRLIVAGAVTTLSAGLPSGPASAQGYGGPSYGQPYSPPWQAGARGDRRALDGSYRNPPPPAPRPAYRPAPAAIWQGLYLGGHGGFAFGRLTDTDFDEAVKFRGAALGLHAGYNAQFGSWVVGLEADGTWSNASGRRDFNGGSSVDVASDWHSSLRARVGYGFDNVLVYGTAGAAFAGVDVGVAQGGFGQRVSDTFFGWAVGAGVEMKLTPNISGRLEAIHYGFGDKTLTFPVGIVPVDLDTTTVRAGLTFHFN